MGTCQGKQCEGGLARRVQWQPYISPPHQPALGQPLGPQGLACSALPPLGWPCLASLLTDSAVQVNRELCVVNLAGLGAPGCNSRGHPSQRSRQYEEQMKPPPSPWGPLHPHLPLDMAEVGLPDLPSRWEQHKESTFHAPHQAHAERLRGCKEQLTGRATSSKQKGTGARVVLINGVLE